MPAVKGPSIPNGFTGPWAMSLEQLKTFGPQTSPPINIPPNFWTGPGQGKAEFYPYMSTTQGQTDGQGNFITFESYVENFAGTGGGFLGDPTKASAPSPVSFVPKGQTGETVFYPNVLAADNAAWDTNPEFKVASAPVATVTPANSIALANEAIALIKRAVPGSA